MRQVPQTRPFEAETRRAHRPGEGQYEINMMLGFEPRFAARRGLFSAVKQESHTSTHK